MADFVLDEDVSEALQLELERLEHDALTTRNLRSKGTDDEAQLSTAVRLNRIFATHNVTHYRMLQRAWRRWSNEWEVVPRPHHPGILLIPQSPLLPTNQAAVEVDALLLRPTGISNRLFALHPSRGWEQIG